MDFKFDMRVYKNSPDMSVCFLKKKTWPGSHELFLFYLI